MPRGDRTGPLGLGARTGRARGYCAGSASPGYLDPYPGRGFARGGGGRGGGGRGFRNMFFAAGSPRWSRYGVETPYRYTETQTKTDPGLEKEMLREQLRALQEDLSDIRRRLDDMGTANTTE